MTTVHKLYVCGGSSTKYIRSVDKGMLVDEPEGSIAVDGDGVFGTARLPACVRLAAHELAMLRAPLRAWQTHAPYLPRGDERGAVCVGYVGGWCKGDGDTGQAMPHSHVDATEHVQLAYLDAQIALGRLLTRLVLPRVKAYLGDLLDIPLDVLREIGLYERGPFMGYYVSCACGTLFWPRVHVDDDVWLTILVALGDCAAGGGWANPTCGVIHEVHAGDILVVNPRVAHGTCEFGDVNADREMIAVYMSTGCFRGALTSMCVAMQVICGTHRNPTMLVTRLARLFAIAARVSLQCCVL